MSLNLFVVAILLVANSAIIVSARSILLPDSSDQPSSTSCTDALIRRLNSISGSSSSSSVAEAVVDNENSSLRLFVEDYFNCVAGVTKHHQTSSVLSHRDYDVLDRKQIESDAVPQSGEESQAPPPGVGVRQLQITSNEMEESPGGATDEVGVIKDVDEGWKSLTDVVQGRSGTVPCSTVQCKDVVQGQSAAVPCSTVQCKARRAWSTFEPCRQVSEEQCSALISVIESALQLHLDQKPSVNVEESRLTSLGGGIPEQSLVEENMADKDDDTKDYHTNNNNNNNSENRNDDDEQEEFELLRRALLARLGAMLREYQLWQLDQSRVRSGLDVVDSTHGGERRMWTPRRVRRAIDRIPSPSKLSNLSLKIPSDKLTPDMLAYIQYVQTYRKMNGSGKLNARFG